ncbi:MAG: hypothetical protein E7552_02285 [Ruminococcaceae bacterium]|nr:hypothetical protein [Oscillospiraceae bacterium]
MKEWLKRLGILLIAVFLLAYVGYQIFQVLYSNVTVETVSAYSVYDTVETQAIAFRNETPVQADVGENYLFYTLDNGNRVSKNGIVAQLYADEEVASLQQQLELLDEEIVYLKSAQALTSGNYSGLEAIEQQLTMKMQEIAVRVHGQGAEELRGLRAQLLTLMNKRQVIVGTVSSFEEKLAQLNAERNALASRVSDSIGTVRAPVSGYFIDRTDGYESYFSVNDDDMAALTAEEIQKALTASPEKPSGCVGKISSGYYWYLACSIDSQKAAALEVGDALDVRLPFVTAENVPTKVLAVNQGENNQSALILKCSLMSEELSDIRLESVQLLLEKHNGLRLPDKALHFDKDNRTGAFVRMGTTVTFRYVDVLYHNEKDKYSICAIPDAGDKTYVQLYDDVIVEGKDLYDGKVVQS